MHFGQAAALGEKVIVIGHAISSDWSADFGWRFAALVDKYQSTIVNQFYGHSHTTHFQVWYDNVTATNPINVGFIGGSVTPYTSLSPGFMMYFYDRASLPSGDSET